MAPLFQVKNLTKEYGSKRILDIGYLEIQERKTTALIGPSGAGKSTLLLILNGLETATTGTIRYDGKECWKSKPDIGLRREMAIVFQKPVVFNNSVFDNISYSLKLRGQSKQTVLKQVEEMLELVGLQEQRKQRAATLSGGEAQRLALARAMIYKPRVLFLDEPTANLDPSNVVMIEKLLSYFKTEYHTTVVIVTHNMHQARRLADDAVFMLDGRIIERGETRQLFENPAEAKTRDFIAGEMIY